MLTFWPHVLTYYRRGAIHLEHPFGPLSGSQNMDRPSPPPDQLTFLVLMQFHHKWPGQVHWWNHGGNRTTGEHTEERAQKEPIDTSQLKSRREPKKLKASDIFF